MTFDEVMKKYNGVWENGAAVILGQGGYYWRIAQGSPDNYTLTVDGKRYVTEAKLAYTSTDVVVSAPKKRGRAPVVEQVVAPEPEVPDSLDDLDI